MIVGNKKWFFFSLRIFVSVSLLALLFWLMRNNLDQLLQILCSVKIGQFLIAMLVGFFGLVVSGLRLKTLFLVHDIKFNIIEITQLTFIGFFFNNFMPSTIGGDMVKVYYVRKRCNGFIRPLSTMLVDRVLGLTTLIFLSGLSLLVWGHLIENIMARWIIVVLILTLSLFMIFFSSEKFARKFMFLLKFVHFLNIEEKLRQVYRTIAVFRKSKQLLLALFFSFFAQIALIFGTYILALSLSIELPLYIFFMLIPLIGVTSSLPSINGLGIREGAFIYFFKDFINTELAFALSILFLAQIIVVSIAGGLVYLSGVDIKEREGQL